MFSSSGYTYLMLIITENALHPIHEGNNKLVTFGLPLPQGQIYNPTKTLLLQNNQPLPLDIQSKQHWSDGSLRWIWCQSIINNDLPISVAVREMVQDEALTPNQVKIPSFIQPAVIDSKLFAKNDLFEISDASLNFSVRMQLSGDSSPLSLTLKKTQVEVAELTETHIVSGFFERNNQTIKLHCKIISCKQTGEISVQIRINNPNAAAHEGGQWDLGDTNSIRIEELSLLVHAANAKTNLTVIDVAQEKHKTNTYDGTFSLNQSSSGGEHWKSPIHWDENRVSTVKEHGFKLCQGNEAIVNGLRAEPIAKLVSKNHQLAMTLDGFWQNFPVTVSGVQGTLTWRLLDKNTELQGGESKTWTFRCIIQGSEQSNNETYEEFNLSPPTIRYAPDYLEQCQILPHLAFSVSSSVMNKLIDLGINGTANFFKKREKNDVFGWRHYGELDADHEAVDVPEGSFFISHYNNQYDPLMGMTLQYLFHGEQKWLQLFKPLNRHIQDIDIYDTLDDKAEYNGGLFWHTDHYLSAETASHRSNSKHHTSVYDGFLGGGGPGGQHCYTTGLALQYWLYADESAKNKVEQLCNWVRCFYKGSGSIAERTFRLVTMDFKQNELTNIGIKTPGYKYPLDRGTGNYLVALIDLYDLTQKSELLEEMAEVITHTAHPLESISQRNLGDHENNWFYTVFLQAVVRYLFLKEQINEIDDDYWYARHTFMHYCQWMKENESFYLDNPEQLEFPNDTWCAQEIRKANLFYYASYFSAGKAPEYIEKADKFHDYVTEHLTHSEEAHHTRILSILMQNDGVRQKFADKPRSPIAYQSKHYNAAPSYSVKRVILSYFKDTAKLLMNFSPSSEWQWIRHRISKVLNR